MIEDVVLNVKCFWGFLWKVYRYPLLFFLINRTCPYVRNSSIFGEKWFLIAYVKHRWYANDICEDFCAAWRLCGLKMSTDMDDVQRQVDGHPKMKYNSLGPPSLSLIGGLNLLCSILLEPNLMTGLFWGGPFLTTKNPADGNPFLQHKYCSESLIYVAVFLHGQPDLA